MGSAAGSSERGWTRRTGSCGLDRRAGRSLGGLVERHGSRRRFRPASISVRPGPRGIVDASRPAESSDSGGNAERLGAGMTLSVWARIVRFGGHPDRRRPDRPSQPRPPARP